MNRVLVVGSVHLDILARPFTSSSHKDRMGNVSIEIGGTACNVAFCLRKLGAPVRLLTAWGSSSLTKMMAGHIVASGVDLIADEVGEMPLAAFVAEMTAEGDLKSAVTSTPIDTHEFTMERLAQAMEGVGYIIIEANLRASVMRMIASVAHQRGIAVYALGVSEDKVDRILPCARLLTGAFMNHAECERVLSVLGIADAVELSSILRAPVFVTRGERGAVVYHPDGGIVRILPGKLDSVANMMGVGDAFSAGVIFGMAELKYDEVTAANYTQALIEEIAQQGSCNPYSVNALNTMVADLWETARMDKLTGLFRRGAFEIEFKRLQRGLTTVIVIDCDRFKMVNDTVGHEAGDEVLRAIGRIINKSIRSVDVACRWGGDEFVLLLPRTEPEDAAVVAERIRVAVEKADLHGVTLSLGITAIDMDEELAAGIARADAGMYAAKRNGRNSITQI